MDEKSYDTNNASQYAYNDVLTIPQQNYNTTQNRCPEKFLMELIPQVEKYPVLYDSSICRSKKNVESRLKIWEDIAKKMSRKVDGKYCMSRWHSLRMVLNSALRRHHRQIEKGILPSHSEPKWMYYKPMKFLIPHHRFGSICQRRNSMDDQDINDEVPVNHSTLKKKGQKRQCETIEIDDDDDVANCTPIKTEIEPAPSCSGQKIDGDCLNSVKILDVRCKLENIKEEKDDDDTETNAETKQGQDRFIVLESDELLIETVKKYPVIYMPARRNTDNYQRKLEKWKEVAQELGLEAETISCRWDILKKRFLYIVKRDPNIMKYEDRQRNKWLVDRMKFMTAFLINSQNRRHLYRRDMMLHEWSKNDYLKDKKKVESSNTEDIEEDEAEDIVLTSFISNVLKKSESRVNNRNAIDVAENELSCYTNFFTS